jgi:hypothetical protein
MYREAQISGADTGGGGFLGVYTPKERFCAILTRQFSIFNLVYSIDPYTPPPPNNEKVPLHWLGMVKLSAPLTVLGTRKIEEPIKEKEKKKKKSSLLKMFKIKCPVSLYDPFLKIFLIRPST